MKKSFPVLFLLSVFCIASAAAQTPNKEDEKMPASDNTVQSPSDLAGTWEGNLSIGAVSLRIVFNLTLDNGKLRGTLDSPD